MIKVYLEKDSEESKDIIDSLKKLVVAHEVEYLENTGQKQGKMFDPPVIIDDDRVIQGKENILQYLEELAEFLNEWQRYQSDACYCDSDGNVE